jgi:hypothetical protein
VSPAPINAIVVIILIAASVSIAFAYLARLQMERPPVGRYNGKDILVMALLVVLLPPIYLRLPVLAVGIILGGVFLGVLRITLSPLLSKGALPIAVLLVGADAALGLIGQASDGWAFSVVNNFLVVVAAVGVCNLYVQNGMSARDVALFGIGLAVYDYVATVAFPTMLELFETLRRLPFAPLLLWGRGTEAAPLGLGDLIMLTLWALVAWKAFGLRAGWYSALAGLAGISLIYFLAARGLNLAGGAAMALLGPTMGLQYLLFRHLYGDERTVTAFRRQVEVEAASSHGTDDQAVPSALRWHQGLADQERVPYSRLHVALNGGRVVGVGPSAGEARQQARRSDPAIPVVVYVDAGD